MNGGKWRVVGVVALMVMGLTVGAGAIALPENDDIADAEVIGGLDYVVDGSIDGATLETGETDDGWCGNPREKSVWFTYTPAATSMVYAEVKTDGFYPALLVYKGQPGATVEELTPVGCSTGNGYVVMELQADTTYFMSVSRAAWTGEIHGDYTFGMYSLENDLFANAKQLTDLPAHTRGVNYPFYYYGPIDADARIASPYVVSTLEEGEPAPCGDIGSTLWYRWTSDITARMVAHTYDVSGDDETFVLPPDADPAARTDFDTVVAVYEGPLGADFGDLALLGCNDDDGQGVSRVEFDAVPGTTYYVQVGGYNADQIESLILSDGAEADAAGRAIYGPWGRFDLTLTAICRGRPATIVGTDAGDEIGGTPGNDIIAAIGGDDLVYGHEGNDIICGGPGNDIIFGGDGRDKVFGEAGRDWMYGERGYDILLGGKKKDKAWGGPKVDRCVAEKEKKCEL
ncbi:MAG: hypothetical protein KQH83_09425 [Actinobacteria bacterium]|nr:hypothetical protein [Actinomycetota bacterium]